MLLLCFEMRLICYILWKSESVRDEKLLLQLWLLSSNHWPICRHVKDCASITDEATIQQEKNTHQSILNVHLGSSISSGEFTLADQTGISRERGEEIVNSTCLQLIKTPSAVAIWIYGKYSYRRNCPNKPQTNPEWQFFLSLSFCLLYTSPSPRD